MKTISLKIPKSLEQQLEQFAAVSDVSKSEVVRRALESFLRGKNGHDSTSVAALAGDLIGCFRGPADLSSNADYFDEFGK